MRNKLLKEKSHQRNSISLKVRTMILVRNQRTKPRMPRKKPKRRRKKLKKNNEKKKKHVKKKN